MPAYKTALLLTLLLPVSLFSQVKKKTAVAPPKQSNDLVSTIKKVAAIAMDPGKTGYALTEGGTITYDTVQVYESIIKTPGAEYAKVERRKTRWEGNKGIVSWNWIAVIKTVLTPQRSLLPPLKDSLDGLLTKSLLSFESQWKQKGVTWQTQIVDNNDVSVLKLNVMFKKPHSQTLPEITTIINDLFTAEFNKASTDDELYKAVTQYLDRLGAHGLEWSAIDDLLVARFPAIANRSIRTAFKVFLYAPFFINTDKLKATLTYSQREEFKKLAQAYLDEQENKDKKKEPVKTEKKDPVKATDDPGYKSFIAAFPTLSFPFYLQPRHLVGAKLVSNMPYIKKIFSVVGGEMYAIGLIDDCYGGEGKSLLMGQMSGDQYSRSWIFYVVRLRNGYYSSQSIFADGTFKETHQGFDIGCSLTITANKHVIVNTIYNRNTLTRSAKGSCD